MHTLLGNRVSPIAVTAASIVLLTGCAFAPPPEAPPSASPKPVETVEPVVDGDEEAQSDVLFTVTAVTTDDTGAAVTLTMTGHAPQHWDAAGRESIKNDFIAQCGALGGGSVWDMAATPSDATFDAYGSTFMVIDVSGTPAGRTLAGGVDLFGGSFYYQQVASGDIVPWTYPGCMAGSRIEASGSATIITDYETGTADGDLAQWLSGSYGFSAVHGTAATFTSCTAELTPLAETFDLTAMEGWDAVHSTSTACWIGYQGE